MISVLSSAERTVGAALSPLADDLGSTYIGLVFMSGLCLAPMVMFGLGILCAGAGRRGRRIGAVVTVAIVLFYALSVIGSNFSWPGLEYKGELADTMGLLLLAVGGFLMLPWLLAFGGTKVADRRSANHR